MIQKTKYVDNAPQYLIDLYEETVTADRKRILKNLLVDNQDMKNVWRELSSKIKTEKDWNEIYQLICLAKSRSKNTKRFISKNEIKCHYEKLSVKLKKLAQEIEKDVNLDLRAYDYINEETLSIYGLDGIKNLNSADKAEKANKVLTYWPPMSEVLNDISEKISNKALEVVITKTSSDRSNDKLKEKAFIFSLGNSFKKMFDEYMYGTISTITISLFPKRIKGEFDKNFVKSVLK